MTKQHAQAEVAQRALDEKVKAEADMKQAGTRRYVSDQFLAERYEKTRGTIWRWARLGEAGFPKPIKIGPRTTRWDMNEIETWEAAQRARGVAA